tara:strand:- start:168 stop:338 length:171 start_codon:yes stop_codon:yes gene_type:complete
MDSFVEIYLGESIHPPMFIDVEKVRSFYAIANRKRNSLEDLTTNRVFPTKGLKELG